MPQTLRVAFAQSHTLDTLAATLSALEATTRKAAAQDVAIILFPEAYLGGYPRTCNFGAAIGSRTPAGRDQYLAYTRSAVDLGDTPAGAGDDWITRRLAGSAERGDGTRETLERVARETGVFIVTGLVERAGGSLYCAAVFVDPVRGVVGKRRKVMPTGTERLVWGFGAASTLKAVAATVRGVRVVMGCAICWENFMPLLRYSLYAQGVNLWLAPTADPRDTWEPLCRTIAQEGRCFVISANQCQRESSLPEWITGRKAKTDGAAVVEDGRLANGTPAETARGGVGRRRSVSCRTEENHEIAWRSKDVPAPDTIDETSPFETAKQAVAKTNAAAPVSTADDDEFVSRGGSLIVNPSGQTIAGPIWEKEDELVWTDVDFDDCDRGHLDFDATGHYSRADAFKLTVEGLDLVPPP